MSSKFLRLKIKNKRKSLEIFFVLGNWGFATYQVRIPFSSCLFLLTLEHCEGGYGQVAQHDNQHADHEQNLPWSPPHDEAGKTGWYHPDDSDEDGGKLGVDGWLGAVEDVDEVDHEDGDPAPGHDDADRADANEGTEESWKANKQGSIS